MSLQWVEIRLKFKIYGYFFSSPNHHHHTTFNMYVYCIYLFIFADPGLLHSSAQGLVLALCLGITPSHIQGMIICVAGSKSRSAIA